MEEDCRLACWACMLALVCKLVLGVHSSVSFLVPCRKVQEPYKKGQVLCKMVQQVHHMKEQEHYKFAWLLGPCKMVQEPCKMVQVPCKMVQVPCKMVQEPCKMVQPLVLVMEQHKLVWGY